jgi:hypothetical protein
MLDRPDGHSINLGHEDTHALIRTFFETFYYSRQTIFFQDGRVIKTIGASKEIFFNGAL